VSELLYFPVDAETSIAVEIESDESGFEAAAAKNVRRWSAEQFGAALARGRRAAEEALEQFRSMARPPAEIEIELGVKFVAEAGAVLAKTATEGHLVVKLTWRPTAE